MVERNEAGEVRAAGGVLTRAAAGGGLEVLLVHRPAYGDWTFPKGKAEPGETDEACAVREVEEEAGVRCRLRQELPSARWIDGEGRPKVARYWLLELEDPDATPAASNEIDEVAWVPLEAAAARLTYDRDREVLRGFTTDGKTRAR